MDPFFLWVEATGLSRWLRESLSVFAFPAVLTLHTVGLAFLVGPSVAIDLRMLGAAPRLPLAPMQRFYPLMWAGFWLNAATGALLVTAYPTKALTNPLFYVKLVLIAVALWTLVRIRRIVAMLHEPGGSEAGRTGRRARALAVASIALWLATIFAGRWLAYTYSRLLASH